MDFSLDLATESVEHGFPQQPVTVAPQTPVRDVLKVMKEHATGSILVCQDETLEGIFTERDALKILALGQSLDGPVSEVMSRRPVTIGAGGTVGEAITIMSRGGYRRIPIVDENGRATGLLKVSGILHYLVAHFPEVIYNLPPTPHHMTQQREGA